jgi:hypothetical protein
LEDSLLGEAAPERSPPWQSELESPMGQGSDLMHSGVTRPSCRHSFSEIPRLHNTVLDFVKIAMSF